MSMQSEKECWVEECVAGLREGGRRGLGIMVRDPDA